MSGRAAGSQRSSLRTSQGPSVPGSSPAGKAASKGLLRSSTRHSVESQPGRPLIPSEPPHRPKRDSALSTEGGPRSTSAAASGAGSASPPARGTGGRKPQLRSLKTSAGAAVGESERSDKGEPPPPKKQPSRKNTSGMGLSGLSQSPRASQSSSQPSPAGILKKAPSPAGRAEADKRLSQQSIASLASAASGPGGIPIELLARDRDDALNRSEGSVGSSVSGFLSNPQCSSEDLEQERKGDMSGGEEEPKRDSKAQSLSGSGARRRSVMFGGGKQGGKEEKEVFEVPTDRASREARKSIMFAKSPKSSPKASTSPKAVSLSKAGSTSQKSVDGKGIKALPYVRLWRQKIQMVKMSEKFAKAQEEIERLEDQESPPSKKGGLSRAGTYSRLSSRASEFSELTPLPAFGGLAPPQARGAARRASIAVPPGMPLNRRQSIAIVKQQQQFEELTTQLDEAQEKLEELNRLKNALDAERKERERMEQSLQEATREATQSSKAISNAQEENRRLRRTVQNLETELVDLQARLTHIQEKRRQSLVHQGSHDSSQSTDRDAAREAENEWKTTQDLILQAKEREYTARVEQLKNDLESEQSRLVLEVEQWKAQVDSLNSTVTALNSQLSEKEDMVAKLQRHLTGHDSERRMSNIRAGSLASELAIAQLEEEKEERRRRSIDHEIGPMTPKSDFSPKGVGGSFIDYESEEEVAPPPPPAKTAPKARGKSTPAATPKTPKSILMTSSRSASAKAAKPGLSIQLPGDRRRSSTMSQGSVTSKNFSVPGTTPKVPPVTPKTPGKALGTGDEALKDQLKEMEEYARMTEEQRRKLEKEYQSLQFASVALNAQVQKMNDQLDAADERREKELNEMRETLERAVQEAQAACDAETIEKKKARKLVEKMKAETATLFNNFKELQGRLRALERLEETQGHLVRRLEAEQLLRRAREAELMKHQKALQEAQKAGGTGAGVGEPPEAETGKEAEPERLEAGSGEAESAAVAELVRIVTGEEPQQRPEEEDEEEVAAAAAEGEDDFTRQTMVSVRRLATMKEEVRKLNESFHGGSALSRAVSHLMMAGRGEEQHITIIEDLKRQLKSLKDENRHLLEEASSLRERLDGISTTPSIQALEEKIRSLQAMNSRKEEQLRSLRSEFRDLVRQIETLHGSFAARVSHLREQIPKEGMQPRPPARLVSRPPIHPQTARRPPVPPIDLHLVAVAREVRLPQLPPSREEEPVPAPVPAPLSAPPDVAAFVSVSAPMSPRAAPGARAHRAVSAPPRSFGIGRLPPGTIMKQTELWIHRWLDTMHYRSEQLRKFVDDHSPPPSHRSHHPPVPPMDLSQPIPAHTQTLPAIPSLSPPRVLPVRPPIHHMLSPCPESHYASTLQSATPSFATPQRHEPIPLMPEVSDGLLHGLQGVKEERKRGRNGEFLLSACCDGSNNNMSVSQLNGASASCAPCLLCQKDTSSRKGPPVPPLRLPPLPPLNRTAASMLSPRSANRDTTLTDTNGNGLVRHLVSPRVSGFAAGGENNYSSGQDTTARPVPAQQPVAAWRPSPAPPPIHMAQLFQAPNVSLTLHRPPPFMSPAGTNA
ncbi:unnamed protein product [Vitrella brassicaformis CCMP3155]|uniref:Uncharacterized protein n=3 Tax=Vitrella brassicaformis TaxID=1169539 RepID=A0A0G4GKN9_VITBC|nr:unnamed protein product [Vitrella brassicaformis CCMP3155]|eukprot:CEM30594.1 unnamed protein product [Vitrella brassicaformis CCMP3155]